MELELTIGALLAIALFLTPTAILDTPTAILDARYSRSRGKIRRTLTRIAKIVHGDVVDRGGFDPFTIEWSHQGIPARFTYDEGESGSVEVRYDWITKNRLRIRRESPSGSLLTHTRKLLGAEDIKVGDDAFDARFLVQGRPRSWVLRVLSAATRESVARLAALGDPSDRLRVEVGPSGVSMFLGRGLVGEKSQGPRRFLIAAEAVIDALRDPNIEIVQLETMTKNRTDADCPVCGEAEGAKNTKCRLCGVYYHDECWEYFGRCAIFGCGTRSSRV